MVFHGFFPCQDDSFGIFFRAPNFSYEKMTILLLWIVFFPYLKPKKAVSNKWFLCGEVGARARVVRLEFLVGVKWSSHKNIGGSTPPPRMHATSHSCEGFFWVVFSMSVMSFWC